jgi:hypothetical protein
MALVYGSDVTPLAMFGNNALATTTPTNDVAENLKRAQALACLLCFYDGGPGLDFSAVSALAPSAAHQMSCYAHDYVTLTTFMCVFLIRPTLQPRASSPTNNAQARVSECRKLLTSGYGVAL